MGPELALGFVFVVVGMRIRRRRRQRRRRWWWRDPRGGLDATADAPAGNQNLLGLCSRHCLLCCVCLELYSHLLAAGGEREGGNHRRRRRSCRVYVCVCLCREFHDEKRRSSFINSFSFFLSVVQRKEKLDQEKTQQRIENAKYQLQKLGKKKKLRKRKKKRLTVTIQSLLFV